MNNQQRCRLTRLAEADSCNFLPDCINFKFQIPILSLNSCNMYVCLEDNLRKFFSDRLKFSGDVAPYGYDNTTVNID